MSDPIVEVTQGKLQGKVAVDFHGNNYYCFHGIPYAKPPIGNLRFKAPVPPEPWTGVRDATKEGSESVSKHMIFFHNIGTEDCLILNVFTPSLPSSNAPLKPVMVWIHGGGFTAGSGNIEIYGPDFLITEDVVIVSINYRLGILGFLSCEDTSLGIPGNAGLKDMVMALKWVQNNIKQFNGDPNNVTIFGESAGSAACHYLMLSPTTKGLFHRAILQSGVCLNAWAFGRSKIAVEIANVLGNEAAKTEKEAIAFLKTVPSEKFLEAMDLIPDVLYIDEERPMGPVIEKPNSDAFLTENPLDIMLSGNYNKIPVIMGYTSREGMLVEFMLKKATNHVEYRMKDFQKAIPRYYNLTKGTQLSKVIAERIENFYYGQSGTPEEDVEKFYIMNSDLFFVRLIYITIKALLSTTNQPIYFYRFNLDTAVNLYKKIGNINAPGASHADDLGYLFKSVITPELKPDSIELNSIYRLIKLWTNFAKTGNPNPKESHPLISVQWPATSANPLTCLDIDNELTITTNPDGERMKFWDDISALKEINSKL